jgi:hypothetical protein
MSSLLFAIRATISPFPQTGPTQPVSLTFPTIWSRGLLPRTCRVWQTAQHNSARPALPQQPRSARLVRLFISLALPTHRRHQLPSAAPQPDATPLKPHLSALPSPVHATSPPHLSTLQSLPRRPTIRTRDATAPYILFRPTNYVSR